MRTTKASLGTVVLFALTASAIGCGGKGLGGMGGQIFGDMATKTAGNMMTGGAQKQAQQQQAAAQQQQAAAQQANSQAAPAYKMPSMDMTGTLAQKKAADGTAAWTFTEAGSTISTNVDVSAVDKDARKMAGKNVTVTGHYDTFGTGAFVVEKVAVAQ